MICISGDTIPDFVKFVISLGPKYSYANWGCDEYDDMKIDVLSSTLKHEASSFSELYGLTHLLPKAKSFTLNGHREKEKWTKFETAQMFITTCAHQAVLYMKKRPNLMVLTADKGGKSVVMRRSVYREKKRTFISTGVREGVYSHVKPIECLHEIREALEGEYVDIREVVKPFFGEGHVRRALLEFEPYVMSKFTVQIKVHKDGYPPRPLIAAPDRWAKTLSRWVLMMLEKVAREFDDVKVKNSIHFVTMLRRSRKIRPDQRIVTWDYESMFTNVDVSYPKEAIMSKYHVIRRETTMPCDVFMKLLDFVLRSSSFFINEDDIYQQVKGLTMGNELSQVLADIATNRATINVRSSLDPRDLPFITKYIDDFFAIATPGGMEQFEERMAREIGGLSLKRTDEDESHSVSYLDVNVRRRDDGNVSTSWWQKSYSSKTILSYFSSHPKSTKRATVNQLLVHAISVSSKDLKSLAIQAAKKTLKNSSYPRSYVSRAISDALNHDYSDYNRPRRMKGNLPSKFIACPFYENGTFNAFRRIVASQNMNHVTLSAAPQKKNAMLLFSSKKKPGPDACRVNVVYTLHCMDCGFIFRLSTGRLDLQRAILEQIRNPTSDVSRHCGESRCNAIDYTPGEIHSFSCSRRRDEFFNVWKGRR